MKSSERKPGTRAVITHAVLADQEQRALMLADNKIASIAGLISALYVIAVHYQKDHSERNADFTHRYSKFG